ncbi:MAG TPA: RnfABCDGE type electron transport complex subunit G [bacterium]|nr:RnfABCDGE type electron transport complex subunit G [bacterium]HOY44878.1 RnfABCDGE type electron transport complex subunit G [bacterium]
MKEIVRFGLILMIVSVVAATALAAVYGVTNPRILAQKEAQLQAALAAALPGSDPASLKTVRENGEVLYYAAFAPGDTSKPMGYAFLARGAGYSSTIETIVGVDTLGHILGMKVLYQSETPGLGTKLQEVKYGDKEPWFPRQYLGKPAANVAVDKDGGEIRSITGATISSRAVTRAVNEGFARLRTKLGTN